MNSESEVKDLKNSEVLAEAVFKTAEQLGLSQADLLTIIVKDGRSISDCIDPNSKSGELALLLIRCYQNLYVLVGGEASSIRHWMHTRNHHTSGIPAEQIKTTQGLVNVLRYLDAMRH